MGNQNKTTGEIAEMLFTARAMQEGLNILEPVSDNVAYDRVVECGGRFFRVQVKSSSYREPSTGRWRVNVTKGGSGGRPYCDGDYDILAAYVAEEGVWYCVPAKESASCLRLGGGKYEQYKNNWEVFK